MAIPILRVTPSLGTSESASAAEVKSEQVDTSSFAGYRTVPPKENVYISMVQEKEVDQDASILIYDPNLDYGWVTNQPNALANNEDFDPYNLDK